MIAREDTQKCRLRDLGGAGRISVRRDFESVRNGLRTVQDLI